jgi:uncharacterized membrane protein
MRWIVVLHVFAAFALVAGTIGRNLSLARARTGNDLRRVGAFAELADVFDRRMVIPGSLAVLVLGLWAAIAGGYSFTASGNRWLLVALILYLGVFAIVPTVYIPRGRMFEAALGEAKAQGGMTPELTSALRDPVVAAARTAEMIAVAVIVTLMVAKPF